MKPEIKLVSATPDAERTMAHIARDRNSGKNTEYDCDHDQFDQSKSFSVIRVSHF